MQHMDFDDVEKLALNLSAQDRARLARDLIDSLELRRRTHTSR